MEFKIKIMGKPGIINHAVKFGAIIGLVGIVFSVLAYILNEAFLVKLWFGLVILVIDITLIIYSGNKYRKSLGGFMNFKDAFLVTFLTALVAGLLGLVNNIILYSIIDPDLLNRLTRIAIEQTQQMLQNFGAQQEQIDLAIEKVKVDLPARFSIVGQLRSFFTLGLGIYLIMSTIIGIIIRKKEPELQI